MVFNNSVVNASNYTPVFEAPLSTIKVEKTILNSKILSISHVGLMVIDLG